MPSAGQGRHLAEPTPRTRQRIQQRRTALSRAGRADAAAARAAEALRARRVPPGPGGAIRAVQFGRSGRECLSLPSRRSAGGLPVTPTPARLARVHMAGRARLGLAATPHVRSARVLARSSMPLSVARGGGVADAWLWKFIVRVTRATRAVYGRDHRGGGNIIAAANVPKMIPQVAALRRRIHGQPLSKRGSSCDGSNPDRGGQH